MLCWASRGFTSLKNCIKVRLGSSRDHRWQKWVICLWPLHYPCQATTTGKVIVDPWALPQGGRDGHVNVHSLIFKLNIIPMCGACNKLLECLSPPPKKKMFRVCWDGSPNLNNMLRRSSARVKFGCWQGWRHSSLDSSHQQSMRKGSITHVVNKARLMDYMIPGLCLSNIFSSE